MLAKLIRALSLALLFAAGCARADVPLLSFDQAALRLKEGGYALLMRHAQTDPGTGDPAGFRLDDCKTQRNLSDAGREQAVRTGAAFRAAGLVFGKVLASQWCRCLDTAQLAFDSVEPWPALNSFRQRNADAPSQVVQVRLLARNIRPPTNLVLVTHQVNITALTSLVPAMGEIVAVRWGGDGLVPMFRFSVE